MDRERRNDLGLAVFEDGSRATPCLGGCSARESWTAPDVGRRRTVLPLDASGPSVALEGEAEWGDGRLLRARLVQRKGRRRLEMSFGLEP